MHPARHLLPCAHPGIPASRYATADWRHALSSPHRPFQLVALQGAIAGPLATGLEALTSTAIGIAGSELLYRVAGPAIATQRGRHTALTHGSYTLASPVASLLVAASSGAPVFLGLLAVAGTLRMAGASTLRVGPSWRDPAPVAPVPGVPLSGQAASDVPAPASTIETGRPLAALS